MRPIKTASCSWAGSGRGAIVTSASDRSRFRIASVKSEQSLGHVFRVALPTRQHGCEIVPSMEDHHDQVPQNEQEQCAQNTKMPNPGPMKSAHQRSQEGKLHRIVEDDSRQHGQQTEHYRRGVSHLLKRVVYLGLRWLTPEKEVMADHRPHPGQIFGRDQSLTVITGDHLIRYVERTWRHVDPGECHVPLQCATEP